MAVDTKNKNKREQISVVRKERLKILTDNGLDIQCAVVEHGIPCGMCPNVTMVDNSLCYINDKCCGELHQRLLSQIVEGQLNLKDKFFDDSLSALCQSIKTKLKALVVDPLNDVHKKKVFDALSTLGAMYDTRGV